MMNSLKCSRFLLTKLLKRKLPSTYTAVTAVRKQFFSTSSQSSRNPHNFNQNAYGAIITRADTTVAKGLGGDGTGEIHDKFNLHMINDVKRLFAMLKQTNYRYSLNDYSHFLRRIAQLNEEKNLNMTVNNSSDLKSFIIDIKNELEQGSQDYPVIGSYAWCFWKLSHTVDQELWLTLGDHIIDGRFHTNFNESLCGLEGFIVLKNMVEEDFVDAVYSKLEKNLVLTMLNSDLSACKRITESLVKIQRNTRYVFERVENHLMHYLSTTESGFDLRLMLDILSGFAISGNGSQRLYYAFQLLFMTYYELTPEQQEMLNTGDFISRLVQTFALAKMNHPGLVLEPQFNKMIYELVVGESSSYKLGELVNVVQFIGTFNFENIHEINKLLDQRLFTVKGEMNGADMIRYIDLIVLRDYEEDYSKLPKEIISFFDDYLNKNMEKQDHEQVFFYISEVESRNLMSGKHDLLNHLIPFVCTKMHIHDFEALCYYYWLFNKYNTMIDMESPKIQYDLNQIKDNIRLCSAFSKGRLRIGSNFYKMLEVVSGSDFLTQGEYPEW